MQSFQKSLRNSLLPIGFSHLTCLNVCEQFVKYLSKNLQSGLPSLFMWLFPYSFWKSPISSNQRCVSRMLLNKYLHLRGYIVNSCGPGISYVLWKRLWTDSSSFFLKNYSDILLIVLTLRIFSRSCTCLNNNITPKNLFILQVCINHPLAYNKFQTVTEALDDFFSFLGISVMAQKTVPIWSCSCL